MADAPASGGGISGAEIALIVVLAIGALATLSGNPLSTAKNATSATSSHTTTAAHCGIILTRPTSKEKTAAYVTLVGTITPCTQTDPLSATVNVQVVDSTGAPMSAYTTVNVAAATSTTGSFSANIPITGQPAAGTGYVIVTGPINQNDGTTMTARAQVHFVGIRTPIIYSANPSNAPVIYQTTTTTTTNTSNSNTSNGNNTGTRSTVIQ